MKKIFCDLCGNEMNYAEMPKYLKEGDYLSVTTTDGIKLDVSVCVGFEIDNVPNGVHIDVCHNCRASLLDRLDIRPTCAGSS